MKSHSNRLFVVLAAMAFPLAAHCGNEVGNGGNAVICKGGEDVQLLDLYEAKILRNVDLDPNIKGMNAVKVAKERLNLLEKLDPKSLKVFLANLDHLQKDIHYEDEIQLRPIDDSEHPFIPKDPGCEVRQLAILRKRPLPGEKRVLVNNTIWKKMSVVQQAGLLLHESIYERLALLGETDSTKARYLVSYLMSAKPEKDSSQDYWKMIKDLRLPIYK